MTSSPRSLKSTFDPRPDEKRAQQLDESYREKFSTIEQDKNKQSNWLAKREEDLVQNHQKLERELRNQVNLLKIEQQAAYDEKVRRLAESAPRSRKSTRTSCANSNGAIAAATIAGPPNRSSPKRRDGARRAA